DDGWQIWEPPQSVLQKEDDLASTRKELAEKEYVVGVLRRQVEDLKLEKQQMRSEWTEEKQHLTHCLTDVQRKLQANEEMMATKELTSTWCEVERDWRKEKEHLEQCLADVQQQLKEKEDKLNNITAQQVSLSSELEAMAKIVQDLESQLAKSQEENASLSQNLVELDEQHQGAVEKLLSVKDSLQKQNDVLQSEVNALKKCDADKTDIATECSEPTRPDAVKSNTDLHDECRKNLEAEFKEKITKLITFEIPQSYLSFNNNNNIGTVEALVKMCTEYKWKRDTLERKVAELMKEVRDSKAKYEEKDREARELENECKVLKGNVETLIEDLMISKSGSGESLAPIPENSEEAEMMEQRIISLENEVEVLREARLNLEADANKLREQEQVLIRRLEMTSAALRNQENLETELRKLQENATASEIKIEELILEKQVFQEEIIKLKNDFEEKSEVLKSDEVDNCSTGKIQELESAKQVLEEELTKLKNELKQNSLVAQDYESCKAELAKCTQTVSNLEFKLMQAVSSKHLLEDEMKELEAELKKRIEKQMFQQFKKAFDDAHARMVEAEQTNLQLRDSIRQLDNSLCMERCLKQELDETCASKHIYEQELFKKIIMLQQEIEVVTGCKNELKHKIDDKATLEISDYLRLLDSSQEQLRRHSENTKLLLSELDESKKQLETNSVVQEELLSVKQELMNSHEEVLNLKLIIENLSATEGSYKLLQSAFKEKETQIERLTKEKIELERKLEEISVQMDYENNKLNVDDFEAMKQEIKKWKEMAESSERQLNEVLQIRAELEQECGRLYSIETKIQNQDHLTRELNRLQETSDELEQKYNELTNEKRNLEEKCATQSAQILESDVAKQEALDKTKQSEEKLVVSLEQVKMLEIKCQALESVEEKMKIIEVESMKGKEIIGNLQRELEEITEAKSNLEIECKRLLAVEGKLRNEKNLEAEMRAVREKLADTEQKLAETLEANAQLEEKFKNLQGSRLDLTEFVGLSPDMQDVVPENNRLLEEKLTAVKLEQERQLHGNEAAQMSRETVANLSKIIKNKDMEIEALNQKTESLLKLLQDSNEKTENTTENKEEVEVLRQEVERLVKERSELIATVQVKHMESVQYHTEIQRLSALINSPEGDTDDLRQQVEKLEAECVRLANSLKQEQTRYKYLQNEVQEQHEKESVLLKELERLRLHLVEVEDMYTQETLKAEERAKDLQNKLAQAEEQIKTSSTAYTSANIRANQHVESLQGQARLIAQQRDELQQKLSASEDLIQHHTAALRNLQIVSSSSRETKRGKSVLR
ncbi:hypothetical protein L9F63_003958, partial [Diploptera punctata]